MKFIILFVLINCSISLSISAQSDAKKEQVIQYSSGKPTLTFEVKDYATGEPLIGANILSRDLKKSLAKTNIDGIVIIDKNLSKKFRVEYVGYDDFCLTIIDNTTDCVIVELKADTRNIGIEILNPKEDSLKDSAEDDAEMDIDEGNIRLYYLERPTEEQFEFSVSYSFNFIDGSQKEGIYISTYNETVLEFLNDMYEKSITDELKEICWYNWF